MKYLSNEYKEEVIKNFTFINMGKRDPNMRGQYETIDEYIETFPRTSRASSR